MMKDFFTFRRMLTPWLINLLFWLVTLAVMGTGIVDVFKGEVLKGLEIMFIGPILVRIMCEIVIVFFRMNETLTDIRNKNTP